MPTGEGFHDFYRDAYPRLVAQLYAVTADLGLAEDVVQEAFVRAASRWPQVSTYQAPEAWVRKVALRLRLDALRRVRRQAAALTRLGARPRPQPALDPEDRELVEALRRLPRRYREVLVLHHCLDRSVEDVGVHLGVPAATVKTRLARGRTLLAGLLAGADDQASQSQQGARHARP
ncbi:MAG TPA: sigma-70 family RNA polymerase sigma factor [Actinomycetota bacterium]|nr:sigma-70 family RNA polymerase sigma factor [Actinomycetota bacterium]